MESPSTKLSLEGQLKKKEKHCLVLYVSDDVTPKIENFLLFMESLLSVVCIYFFKYYLTLIRINV